MCACFYYGMRDGDIIATSTGRDHFAPPGAKGFAWWNTFSVMILIFAYDMRGKAGERGSNLCNTRTARMAMRDISLFHRNTNAVEVS